MTAAEWIGKASAHLSSRRVPEAEANAEFIMAAVLKTGRAEVRLHSGRTLTEHQGRRFWHLVSERGKRIPLAYVLGTQAFMGLEIEVNPHVMIPRPETEEAVSEAERLLKGREREPLHLLEIGTGSGCIAIALSVRFPQALVFATEVSPQALRLAMRNAQAHHRAGHIHFLRKDLFKQSAGRLGWADLVISNPPYIPTGELERLPPEVQEEPRLALDGGKDGLDALRAIIAEAPRHLKPGGWLVLEIGAGQGQALRRLLESAGLLEVAVRKDAQGLDRIAVGVRQIAALDAAPTGGD